MPSDKQIYEEVYNRGFEIPQVWRLYINHINRLANKGLHTPQGGSNSCGNVALFGTNFSLTSKPKFLAEGKSVRRNYS